MDAVIRECERGLTRWGALVQIEVTTWRTNLADRVVAVNNSDIAICASDWTLFAARFKNNPWRVTTVRRYSERITRTATGQAALRSQVAL